MAFMMVQAVCTLPMTVHERVAPTLIVALSVCDGFCGASRSTFEHDEAGLGSRMVWQCPAPLHLKARHMMAREHPLVAMLSHDQWHRIS